MPTSRYVNESMTASSWIRKMFEKGILLKKEHGDKNVFDLTLGNPVMEPPEEFFETLARFARPENKGIHQ